MTYQEREARVAELYDQIGDLEAVAYYDNATDEEIAAAERQACVLADVAARLERAEVVA